MTWEKELSIARHAALEAGAILKNLLGRINQVAHKGFRD
jgi:hypothetical protein